MKRCQEFPQWVVDMCKDCSAVLSLRFMTDEAKVGYLFGVSDEYAPEAKRLPLKERFETIRDYYYELFVEQGA